LLHEQTKVRIENTSYDPTGRPLKETQLIVKKGRQDITDSVPYENGELNFSGLGAGEYSIIAKVKNADDVWSEEFVRTVIVIDDQTDPTITVDHPNGSFYLPDQITM